MTTIISHNPDLDVEPEQTCRDSDFRGDQVYTKQPSHFDH